MRNPVFLTGATGFLGMEVLARLLGEGRPRRGRARSERRDFRRGDRAAAPRDGEAVAGPVAVPRSVKAIAGDVTSPGFGMSGEERAVAEEVTAVMHCAA